MKNAVTKAKIIGVGLPVISSVGALGLWHFGINLSKYTSLLFEGFSIAELNVWTNYLKETRSGKRKLTLFVMEGAAGNLNAF